MTHGRPDKAAAQDAELVRNTERARVDALMQGNLDAARQLHSDEFELVTPEGEVLSK